MLVLNVIVNGLACDSVFVDFDYDISPFLPKVLHSVY